MTEVQELQLSILVKLDEVCHRHNLRYYLAYGTCLGAVRHQGFIPWDHDIDVLMPVSDVKKLTQYQSEFGKQYFVENRKTDKDFKSIITRIVDRTVECHVIKEGKIIKKSHIFIDVYPFYDCPKTKAGLIFNIWRSHMYKVLVGGVPQNHGLISKVISRILLIFFKEKNRERDIRKIENKMMYKGESNSIADYYGLDVTFCTAITYDKAWFSKPSKLLFEGCYFDGPTNPDRYLSKRYGDYMTPPSMRERNKEVKYELIKKR